MTMKSQLVSLCVLLLAARLSAQGLSCQADELKTFPYCNPNLPVPERVSDLLGRMTLAEKISQLNNEAPEISRLGIPKYNWWSESLHGVLGKCASEGQCPTSFPSPINMGASFNKDMIKNVAQAISSEGRAMHHNDVEGGFDGFSVGLDFWAPNINIFRDPRWGRGFETPGEDPYLSGQYAVNYVRGMQEGNDHRYLKTVATCKHFAAYSLESWNGTDRYHFDAIVSDKDLVQTYTPAFRACVTEGKVRSIMCSYNSVNGVPACANPFLMQTLLRDTWGFDGYVVSDCDAVSDIFNSHHYAPSWAATVQSSVKAGCDMCCGDSYKHLQEAVETGLLSEFDIDQSIRRSLNLRFEVGLFDSPSLVPYSQIPLDVLSSDAHKRLALHAARESIVLLKNDNNILPLRKDKLKKITVVGPHSQATNILCSNYYRELPNVISPFDALKNRLGDSVEINLVTGCDVPCLNDTQFDSAVKSAQDADVVLAFMGIDMSVESEGLDRVSIDLPGRQNDLLKAVFSANQNLIVILINGGPVSVEWAKTHAPGIIEAFYPGEQGADAIVDILFGDYNPSARLPVTVYPSEYVNQISLFDMSMSASPGRTYRFYTGTPLWEFGFGLSYTTFNMWWYSVRGLRGSPPLRTLQAIQAKEVVNYRVNVMNTGSIAGGISVLAFIVSNETSGDSPRKQLVGFEKVFLQPSEQRDVFFDFALRDINAVNEKGQRILREGRYTVMIGSLVAEYAVMDTLMVDEPIEIEQ
eukprot:GILK01008397.1.p1 GENE.GILK01008397.1~~GILK01008397.1.p1  ORF type:complete len:751 (-),score=119.29 GILK01008397.1:185-2437(-)